MRPFDAQIKLLAFPSWNWGHSYVATFANEQQAIAFCERKKSSCAIQEVPGSPIHEKWVGLLNTLYPICEHGLSAHLCMGPDHYPTNEQEREMEI